MNVLQVCLELSLFTDGRGVGANKNLKLCISHIGGGVVIQNYKRC